MNITESKKYVASRLKDAIKYRTNIVLGNACSIFKQIYKGEIISINTATEVKQFLEDNIYEIEKPLVFEDLSKMSTSVQAYLLKFIEEPIMPIIVLSSADNISPILLSRFLNVVKIEARNIVHKKYSITDYVENRSKDEVQEYSLENDLAIETEVLLTCPEYLYFKNKYNKEVDLSAKGYDKYFCLLDIEGEK